MTTGLEDSTYDVDLGIAYNPKTGQLFRIKELRTWSLRPDRGDLGGRTVRIEGRNRQATHAMWKIMTGEYPEQEIDHIDRDVTNNRWSNLRLASKSQNSANRVVSGIRIHGLEEGMETGVSKSMYRKQKRYRVMVDHIFIGNYATVAEANEVSRRVRAAVQGEFVPVKPINRRI